MLNTSKRITAKKVKKYKHYEMVKHKHKKQKIRTIKLSHNQVMTLFIGQVQLQQSQA